MLPLSVMALFCEDIREEKGDIFTLIGLLPDTVELSGPPGEKPVQPRMLTKLSIYIRINFDPDQDIGASQIRLKLPDDEIISLGEIGPDIIQKARADAKAKGNLLAGVISRITFTGFQPPLNGSIRLEVDVGGETHLAAALTFKLKESDSTPSSASPPPSEQSQSAAS